jgi:hypothetical protein
VLEPTGIEEVKERVRDFTRALRQAGAEDIAQRIEDYAAGFIDHTQVRRSIDAIKQQLQYFRNCPEELPELPIVLVAANRLEDVCRDALRAGVIEPARPSLRAAGKRKLSLVTTTLVAAGLGLLLPLVVTMYGLDLNDLPPVRTLPELRLAQGDEASIDVNALIASAAPSATRKVEFYVLGHCARDLPDGSSCRAIGPRGFGGEKLPAYEVMLDNQVYGLFIAFSSARLIGAVGSGKVLLATSPETPQGRYSLPLQAAFSGYAPEPCALWQKLTRRCPPPEIGAHLRHEDIPTPAVIVQVVAPDPSQPSAAERRKAREEAERRTRAAERATLIAGAVVEIKAALDDTERMLRHKQYDAARARLDKLAQLFAPFDAAMAGDSEGDPLPVEVSDLRARFEIERRELRDFGDHAFDVAYSALNKRSDPSAPDDGSLAETAHKLGISREYMESIYAEHADQLEVRLAAEEEARNAAQRKAASAVISRCGELPTTAFREVRSYLEGIARGGRSQVRVQECFTPRLHEKTCWRVVCRFDELVPGPIGDKVTSHTWTFTLHKGRVVDHIERAVEGSQ